MTDTIQVVFAADDAYAPPLAVSIVSLLRHAHKPGPLVISIMDGGISEANCIRLLALAEERPETEIRFIGINNSDFENFPIFISAYTIATYYRLKLPSLMPDVDKVLYLDSDIVVEMDIRDMWELPMDGSPLLVVEEPRVLNEHRLVMLDIPHEAPYFNAGILVMDLAWMRRENMEEAFVRYIEKHGSHLQHQDQDVLNGCFVGKWKLMPPRFNMMFYMTHAYKAVFVVYTPEDILEARRQPGIIHFNHHPKPWNPGAMDPRRGLFFKYARMSGFTIPKPRGPGLRRSYLYARELTRLALFNHMPWLHARIRKLLRVYRRVRYGKAFA